MRVPALLPAIASDIALRSSRRAPAIPRECRVRRCAHRASTTIWSACRTVETRCEIRIVVRCFMTSCRRRRMRSSVSVSTLESASSRIRIRGSRITARARAVRCFCPPESVIPRSPTMVSKPRRELADFRGDAGDLGGVFDASGPWRPPRQRRCFREVVSLNRNVSCGTKPMARRSVASGHSRIGRPSMSSVSAGASHSRATSAARVLLPLPVGPTIARVEPGRNVQVDIVQTRAVPLRRVAVHRRLEPSPLRVVGYVKSGGGTRYRLESPC